MPDYYVDNGTDDRGEHQVHREACQKMPSDRTDLGFFLGCSRAVEKAKTIYRQSNGCIHCSRECHTSW